MTVAHVRVNAPVAVAPLVGLVKLGVLGAVVSRYPVSVVERYSLPVDKETYIVLSQSAPDAIGKYVMLVQPVKTPDVRAPIVMSPVIE
jgi:hypothetical protein